MEICIKPGISSLIFLLALKEAGQFYCSENLFNMYSGNWELGTPKGLSKTVLNSEVILFLRSIFM